MFILILEMKTLRFIEVGRLPLVTQFYVVEPKFKPPAFLPIPLVELREESPVSTNWKMDAVDFCSDH